jgi:hypothetical protein
MGTIEVKDDRLWSSSLQGDGEHSRPCSIGVGKTRMHRARQRMKASINSAAGHVPVTVAEGKLP